MLINEVILNMMLENCDWAKDPVSFLEFIIITDFWCQSHESGALNFEGMEVSPQGKLLGDIFVKHMMVPIYPYHNFSELLSTYQIDSKMLLEKQQEFVLQETSTQVFLDLTTEADIYPSESTQTILVIRSLMAEDVIKKISPFIKLAKD